MSVLEGLVWSVNRSRDDGAGQRNGRVDVERRLGVVAARLRVEVARALNDNHSD